MGESLRVLRATRASLAIAMRPRGQYIYIYIEITATASIAQLVEHALRKRTVVGSIPTGGFLFGSRARQKMSMRNAQHGAATHWRM